MHVILLFGSLYTVIDGIKYTVGYRSSYMPSRARYFDVVWELACCCDGLSYNNWAGHFLPGTKFNLVVQAGLEHPD